MKLPLTPPYPPMEALPGASIPEGAEWQYEPKWDGFRCLAFRDGSEVELQSKSGQSLGRYFPEVVEAVQALKAKRFVLDGEIAVPIEGEFSFDNLLQRIHPAASRVAKLSRETPAVYIVFDLLVDGGVLMADKPLSERRARLEAFAGKYFDENLIRLSAATAELAEARRWLRSAGGKLDGIIAKRTDAAYESGERSGAYRKIKRVRTADCVVGGFRYAEKGPVVGSLLLGLYEDGLLHHVGFTSSLRAGERAPLTRTLEALVEAPGFTGRAPGGPSRWSTKRSTDWKPLRPELVVEVQYDHFTGGRFRHGTKLVRWRPDKAPRQCTMDQVKRQRAQLVNDNFVPTAL